MLIEENQSILDLGIMLEGNLDNIFSKIMVDYNFSSITDDISNKIINPIYNTDDNIVNLFKIDNIKIVTSEKYEESLIIQKSFDSGFDSGYDI